MKKMNLVALVGFLALSATVSPVRAEDTPQDKPLIVKPYKGDAPGSNTRMTYGSSVYVEALGRGLLWNVGFDQVINENLSAGAGFGTVGTKSPLAGIATDSAQIIPVYASYYFMKSAGSPFLTAGIDLVLNQDDVKGLKAKTSNLVFPDNTVMPTFGVGYENRTDTGFLFRLTAYGIGGDSFKPWVGITFGLCF